MFAEGCPLPQLRGRKCPIRGIRTYRFGGETVKSYLLSVEGAEGFSLSVAEDAEGHYLAISRQLNEMEQDQWFGRDALSFFTEESTAKTIRCKIDRVIEAAWAAERYIKSVDWVPGILLGETRGESPFHYNLLVNETGEKALEIEHYDTVNYNHVSITVYRPVEDILTIAEAIPHIPAPPVHHTQAPSSSDSFRGSIPVMDSRDGRENDGTEKPIPAPQPVAPINGKPRPDFRRATEEEIHVLSTPAVVLEEKITEPPEPPLPSFLMSRENEAYISLDEVIPPEPERVRCSVTAAKAIIDVSLERGVRVRDVLRDLLGLESALSEEVIFELPLTEKDYRILAQRYKLRPDHRDEIRVRLQEELRRKLLS